MDPKHRQDIHEAIVRLADGDRAAFPVIMDLLWPLILAFARQGIGHERDAEDIAQEVFLRICSRIADFDRSRDGLSWAFGIARYEVLTHRRRRMRRREAHTAEALELFPDPQTASQEERLEQQEIAAALEHVLGELSAKDRLALGLLNASEHDSTPAATRRKRRQRALERLSHLWRNLYGEP